MSPWKKNKKNKGRSKKTQGKVASGCSQPQRRQVDITELEQVLTRLESQVKPEDFALVKGAVETLVVLTQELELKGASIRRLRQLLFGSTTEKTSTIIGQQDHQGHSEPSAQSESHSPHQTAEGVNDDSSTDSDRSAAHQPAKNTRKGHGRNGATAYQGAQKETISHQSLEPGDTCPECLQGKVYRQAEPKVLVRVVGMAPLSATVYELERLRCNLCGQVFTATAPSDVGEQKYDATAKAMVVLLKYGCGFPFNRLEKLQQSLGIPLPSSTQWDLGNGLSNKAIPVYTELIKQAAQGEVLHNDDTTMRILHLDQPPDDESAAGSSKERKGVYTSGIVSVGQDHQIALFFTGRAHAGERLEQLLSKRAAHLSPPVQMCDGLSHNVPKEFETIVSNCLAHARRNFVYIFENFPKEVEFVLEKLGKVYQVDKQAKEHHLTAEQRLELHQEKSGPVMAELKQWLDEQIENKQVEPNSSLGQAIEYMRKRWDKLTRFLTVPGAPLDNNRVERALKKAILHRKNSMFYKTEHGALVGDIFMTLIYTCELCGANPFDYLVALQRHHEAVAESPGSWLPWNYQEALSVQTEPAGSSA